MEVRHGCPTSRCIYFDTICWRGKGLIIIRHFSPIFYPCNVEYSNTNTWPFIGFACSCELESRKRKLDPSQSGCPEPRLHVSLVAVYSPRSKFKSHPSFTCTRAEPKNRSYRTGINSVRTYTGCVSDVDEHSNSQHMSSSPTSASHSLPDSTPPPETSTNSSPTLLSADTSNPNPPFGLSVGLGITVAHPSTNFDSYHVPPVTSNTPLTSFIPPTTFAGSPTPSISPAGSDSHTQIPDQPPPMNSTIFQTSAATFAETAANSSFLMPMHTSPALMSTGHSGLTSGAAAGLAAAMSVVVTCLVMASCLYIARHLRREAEARVDPFVCTYHLFGSLSSSRGLTCSNRNPCSLLVAHPYLIVHHGTRNRQQASRLLKKTVMYVGWSKGDRDRNRSQTVSGLPG